MAADIAPQQNFYARKVAMAEERLATFIANVREDFDPTVSLRPVPQIRAKEPPAITHDRMHTALMMYWGTLHPYKDDLETLWKQDLYELHVEDNTIDLSLDNLDDISHLHVTRTHQSNNGPSGVQNTEVQYRVLLPLEAVEKAHLRLNNCVKKIGMMPDVEPDFEDGHLL